MNKKKILKEFKEINNLNFKITKYYNNSYFYNFKNSTYFNCDFAKKIITNLNDFLIEKFNKKLVIYNIDFDIESLKTQTLKNYVENRINQYIEMNNNIE